MIGFICLSDLHAGALTSLLTDLSKSGDDGRLALRPADTSALTEAFAAAMKAFLDRAIGDGDAPPQLILLGDVLDLQFSRRSDATASALGFLSALSGTGHLSGEVIATAGNHDHALWTDARQALDAHVFAQSPGDTSYLDATPAFSRTPSARSRLLDALLKEAGFTGCDFRYPNLGFADEHRMVLLHHGHFVEREYRLMTSVKDALEGRNRAPPTVGSLSAENAGWIDFAWSSFGDAAGLGHDAERLYQNMLTTTGFRRLTREWSAKATEALAKRLPMSGNLTMRETLDMLSRVGLDITLGSFRDTERYAEVEALTPGGLEGLRWYLEGPSARQVRDELLGPARRLHLPQDATFVFGHTHKPFSERIKAKGFTQPVKVYNTGGWTLNGPRLDNAEGAAMVLIDDRLNTASVRLFSTPRNGKVPLAHVEMLLDGNADAKRFRDEIQGWLDASAGAWRTLADVATEAYQLRQQYLLQLTADDCGRGPDLAAAP